MGVWALHLCSFAVPCKLTIQYNITLSKFVSNLCVAEPPCQLAEPLVVFPSTPWDWTHASLVSQIAPRVYRIAYASRSHRPSQICWQGVTTADHESVALAYLTLSLSVTMVHISCPKNRRSYKTIWRGQQHSWRRWFIYRFIRQYELVCADVRHV